VRRWVCHLSGMAPEGDQRHLSARRAVTLIAAATLLVAVALIVAPWDRTDEGSAGSAAVPGGPPASSAPASAPRRSAAPGRAARKSVRRRRPLPRAGISPDPLPAQGRVPLAPEAGLQILPARCCSEDRRGRQVDAIVLHSTEMADKTGFRDLAGLTRFFARVRRSSHVANDGEGHSSRMVDDGRLAYHATYWNVSTVGLEQMGFSAFTGKDWLSRPIQLESTARWIAHWAALHRIPIRRCEVAGLRYNRRKRVVAGQITRRGVCSHAQLDPRNRRDPGAGYPWDAVLRRARQVAAATG